MEREPVPERVPVRVELTAMLRVSAPLNCILLRRVSPLAKTRVVPSDMLSVPDPKASLLVAIASVPTERVVPAV